MALLSSRPRIGVRDGLHPGSSLPQTVRLPVDSGFRRNDVAQFILSLLGMIVQFVPAFL